MDDFNTETDSDYTSYWRDWVGDTPFCYPCTFLAFTMHSCFPGTPLVLLLLQDKSEFQPSPREVVMFPQSLFSSVFCSIDTSALVWPINEPI
jgi:hypothetical protein